MEHQLKVMLRNIAEDSGNAHLKKAVAGLMNEGASCLINASVQALFAFPVVRQGMLASTLPELRQLAHSMLAGDVPVRLSLVLLDKFGYEDRQEDAFVVVTIFFRAPTKCCGFIY